MVHFQDEGVDELKSYGIPEYTLPQRFGGSMTREHYLDWLQKRMEQEENGEIRGRLTDGLDSG